MDLWRRGFTLLRSRSLCWFECAAYVFDEAYEWQSLALNPSSSSFLIPLLGNGLWEEMISLRAQASLSKWSDTMEWALVCGHKFPSLTHMRMIVMPAILGTINKATQCGNYEHESTQQHDFDIFGRRHWFGMMVIIIGPIKGRPMPMIMVLELSTVLHRYNAPRPMKQLVFGHRMLKIQMPSAPAPMFLTSLGPCIWRYGAGCFLQC